MGGRLAWHLRLGALALLGAASPGGAPLAALSFRYTPAYDAVDTTTTDQSGATTHSSSTALTQRYFLSLDQSLFPNVQLGGTALYQWILGSSSTPGGPSSESDARLWNVDARLRFGDPVLRGIASYTLSQQSSSSLTGMVSSSSPTLVHDTIGLSGYWGPDRLPDLQVIFARDTQHDQDRKLADLSGNQLLLLSTYRPEPHVDLRARFLYANTDDHLNGASTTSLGEELRASWGNDFLDRLMSLYAGYVFNASRTQTTASGTSGTVLLQQFPVPPGLSTIEGLTDTPARDKLNPNPALIDGDTTVSAGVNIGFGPSTSGRTEYRDLGVQLPNTITPVNLLYVWVDKPLPAAVASAFTWTAYQSDDNQNWTPVTLAGPVVFGLFQNRFEIPITSTQARYLKVVTRPLALGVTTDTLYSDVLVTEVQTWDRLPAGSVRQLETFNGFLNTSATVQIIRSHLSYNFAFSLQHVSNPVRAIWSVTNGLAFNQKLSRILGLSARADRSDGNEPRGGHDASTRWSAALDASPLPALGASLSYSGDVSEGPSGSSSNNSVGLFARAGLYEGLSLFGSAGYTTGARTGGQLQQNETVTAGLSVVPNPKLSLSGNFTWSHTLASGAGLPEIATDTWRVDGSLSFTPVPALYLTGGVSRGVISGVGQTLVNFSGSFSPFPGGNLLMTFRYNENLDTLSQSKSRILGPYLRWTIKGATYIEASYTWLDSSTPALQTNSRVLDLRLTLLL
jgi:hypothetical protein